MCVSKKDVKIEIKKWRNSNDSGIIIFGIDEKQDYKEVGVYDPQDIQKKINEQCLQMEPIVRPLLTVVEKDGKSFVSAEIPGVDLADKPKSPKQLFYSE